MTARFNFKPGATVMWRGKLCTILEAVTASSVLVEVAETKASEVVSISNLRPPKGAEDERSMRSLDNLAPEDRAEAKRRFAIIKLLVRCERRSEDDIKRVVDQHGVPRAGGSRPSARRSASTAPISPSTRHRLRCGSPQSPEPSLAAGAMATSNWW